MTPESGHPAGAVYVSNSQLSEAHGVQEVGMGHSFSHHHHYGHQPQLLPWQPSSMLNDLPLCASTGCTNRVHIEYLLSPEVQRFNYCSPKCRDRDLLEVHQQQLEYDLEDLKEKLQSSALADKLLEPPQGSDSGPHHQYPNARRRRSSSLDTPTVQNSRTGGSSSGEL